MAQEEKGPMTSHCILLISRLEVTRSVFVEIMCRDESKIGQCKYQRGLKSYGHREWGTGESALS